MRSYHILSSSSLPAPGPLSRGTYDPIISYPFLLYPPEYRCKNRGPRQGVCTYELILNVPDKIAVVPSTHTSLKLQLRRATLHYWPAGALECIVQPVLHLTDKSTVVSSTHTSLKLQLRRATLHYWPAGRRPLSSSCVEQLCTIGRLALECIVQPVPKPCTTGRPAPLKLQLRRATLHYWPAGARMHSTASTKALHYWPAGAP